MLSANEEAALTCIFVHESSPVEKKKKGKSIEGIEKKKK